MTNYTLHGKNVVHMTVGSNELHFFYDAQGKPAVVVYNGTAYAYVKNLQGDIIAILDSAGTAVVSYTYDAWGAPTGITGSMATTLGGLNPFRYRGYVYDADTQLYYLRSRYYNPNCCRFLNADSVFSFNLFTYCKNSPIANADSAGHLSGRVSPMLVDYLHDLYPWYPWDWDKLLDQYRVVDIDTPYFDYANLRSSPFIVNNYSPESNRVKKIYAEHVYCMFVVGDGQLEGNNVPDYAIPKYKNPYRVWFQVLIFYDNGDGKPTVYKGYMAAECLWMPNPDTVWCFDNDDLINLRNTPDDTDDTNILAQIKQGTTVNVLHDNGDGWVYVSAEGKHGWMMDTFIPKY